MMKSVISSDKHMLNQRERDALHHGPDFIKVDTFLSLDDFYLDGDIAVII